MARSGLITLTEKRLSPPPADLFLLECIGRNTSSGITGVSYDACVPKYTRYQAYYKDPFTEKLITKTFSVNKYGKEEAFRLACEWRIEQIAELNKQGAGYTERHGT